MYFWVYLNLGTTVGCRNSECQLVTPTRIKQSVVFHMFWTYSFFFSWAVFNPPPAVYYFWGLHYPIYWGLSSSMRCSLTQYMTVFRGIPAWPTIKKSSVQYHQKIVLTNQSLWRAQSKTSMGSLQTAHDAIDGWVIPLIPLSFSHWIGLRNKYRKAHI